MDDTNESTSTERRGGWAAVALGIVLGLIGLVLTAGGIWLLSLGGSPYYLIAGLALIASGTLIALRNVMGVWLYALVFVGTVIWAFWESGADVWALVPRIVGPAVLMVLVVLVAPLMRRRPLGWPGALGIAAVFVAVMAAGTFLVARNESSSPVRELPAANYAAGGTFIAPEGDWVAYGGTQGAQRYSPLTQITPDNVGGLERAWVAHTRDLPEDMKDNSYGAETTPLKIGDTLYLCSAKNILIALDPATGDERWRYDPQVPDEWIPYTAACRGVAYHEVASAEADAPCARRIIEGTLDARLIAVDARTGRPCQDFGTNGSVSILPGMGPVVPGMVSITSPPVVVRGNIVTGHQVLDGQKLDAPSGVIQAFDAVTGELAWAWDMTAPDRQGRPENGETYTRGTPNMWTMAAADEELGLVYLPMGNAAGDYWSSDRLPAENEYATSLVALDAETGRPAWHFQTVHKDVWDYDLGSQPTLIDLPGGVPAVVLASKQGDIYVLDRRNGNLLTAVEERPVPQGGVEPAQRSPTQPYSLFHTLARLELDERDMWGMSPIDQMVCRIQFRRASYKGMYTPPTADQRWVQYPGYNGGSDWGGIAIDPLRGVIVANYNDMPNYNRLVPREEADEMGWAPRGAARGGDMGGGAEGAGDPQMGAPYAIDVNAGWRLPFTGLLCKEPPYGGIRAIDLRTGETIWDRPLGSARRNGPFGIPSMMPFEIGTPNNGGSVVTAGGLIFIAATTDNLFRAIDMRTGETLWQDVLPAGGQATPITYEANGRQYVVVMAGGHHFMETPIGDELIAYALPAE
ncbi:membrane-bound PQQ-dependent dehydrogenase, glucose/quinate/shikimate family [Altererythrobacter sp. C41]|uniref:membrane-bound PQQ-dependent dehydrogenase, glucose/quinate/shikimate family n=1 Tax=Altererythrobacter sp. C41 TaxID=2806021 RepID=UPI001932A31C|nr:membrane-bound PQQ-dependent dehydrogenase, glucose/quinate/shikimate family [Altererythrobacter sp. C41]MBM0169904.1 membrane-bound PQQ-dependent dehydrogenase, glucose/quinate/shikimate family [Altererythrobacter sp. C41]